MLTADFLLITVSSKCSDINGEVYSQFFMSAVFWNFQSIVCKCCVLNSLFLKPPVIIHREHSLWSLCEVPVMLISARLKQLLFALLMHQKIELILYW